KLADPAVAADGQRYNQLARELGPLLKQVEPYRRYREVQRQLDEAREMAEAEDDAELQALAAEEVERLESAAAALMEDLKDAFAAADPLADRNVIVEIRAGTGGDEAALFVGDLFRMYSRYAEKQR